MNGNPRNSTFTLPGRTYSFTNVGKNCSVYRRHAGHCWSAYSIISTCASGFPSTDPSCGIPPRSTTGVAVGGGVSEPRFEISATAMRAAAAAIAMPKATAIARREGRFVELGFIAAMSRESVPA